MPGKVSTRHQVLTSGTTRRATTSQELQEPPHFAKYASSSVHLFMETLPRQLQDGEAQAFRHLAHSIVSRTLAHESEYRRMQCPNLDVRDWKLLKRQDELSVYKRKKSQTAKISRSTTQTNRPMVLCVGSLDGDLEDILYGFHSKTGEEMHMTLPYLVKEEVECAVLALIEEGSSIDPYHQLSLKWHLADAFSGTKLMKPRDLCTLESKGISIDAHGERYGYYVLQSVDFTDCPIPSDSGDVIRAHVMFCCIYRQTPNSQRVDVYSKGMFDLGGDIPSFLVYNTSCSLMLSVLGAMECAETKRLTLLALKLQTNQATSSLIHDLSTRSLENFEVSSDVTNFGYSNSTPDDTINTQTTMPQSLTRLLSKGNRKTRSRRQTSAEPCCVCNKKPMASIVGATHRICGVCLRGVCNKCHVKRKLFIRSQSVLVVCCKSCLLEAKQLKVDPQAPCPVLP
ncbi:putative START-like domain superfamily protein [Plasmopara halstedii]